MINLFLNRKVALSIVFMCTFLLSFATVDFKKPKFYVDVRIEYGGSSIKGDFTEKMMSIGSGKLSIVALYRVKSKIFIETGIGRSSFGTAYKESNKLRYKAQYIQTPLLIRSFVFKKLSIGAGATYNILTKATEYTPFSDEGNINITNQMKKNFPSATLNLQLGDQGVYCGCTYDYGLSNIRQGDSWRASSFRLYLQMNISEMIRHRGF